MANLLLIDPNPATRSILKAALSDAGHHVDGVGGLVAARGVLARGAPDGLVVDISHPRGMEMLRALKEIRSINPSSVVLLTLDEDLPAVTEAAGGLNYHLVRRASDDDAIIDAIVANLSGGNETPAPQRPLPQTAPEVEEEQDDDLDDSVEIKDGSQILDVYRDLGVEVKSRTQLLLYCDIHRLSGAISSLSSRDQAEVRSVFLSKISQPVAAQQGSICLAAENGLAALLTVPESAPQTWIGSHVAVEITYVAQQFVVWLRQRYPGVPVSAFAVSVVFDTGDFEESQDDEDEVAGELDESIRRAGQIAALAGAKGWSVTASAAAARLLGPDLSLGERLSVRDHEGLVLEYQQVSAIGLHASAGMRERIAQILRSNGNLLKPEAASVANEGGRNDTALHATRAPAAVAAPQAGPGVATPQSVHAAVPAGASPQESSDRSDLVFPGYRILRPLGKGGMAEVFLAAHAATGEERVLKLLPINDGEEEQLQRFIQEYALISQIRDPNVARIYEQGFTQTHAYIAMEFLPGGELRALIKSGMTVEQALDRSEAIAGALMAVHAKGIVHRDLKPSNLMLRADGSLVLADFGIAKGQSELLHRTASGNIVGSPYYLSPEQAESRPVDARCDLYSLGVILFEMLTGTKPYRASNLSDLIRQHIVAPIPRLPQDLTMFQPVIDHLLAKKPSDRIGSAALLLHELKGLRIAFDKTDAGSSPQIAMSAAPAAAEVVMKDSYSVAIIGFDETEKIVLDSTLSLSVRRRPRFTGFNAAQDGRPDIYLVDARDMFYLQTMLAANLDRSVPTVLIGTSDFGTRWPVLKRPIQWTKIFEAFDRVLKQQEDTKLTAVG